MKKITKLKLSFAIVAFTLPLIVHADETPQMGNSMGQPQRTNMGAGSMMTTNQPQMGGAMSGNTNSMAPNSMNSMTPHQSGNMSSGSMMTTNQPQMGGAMSSDTNNMASPNNMAPNSMNKMAPPQSGSMAPNAMTNQP